MSNPALPHRQTGLALIGLLVMLVLAAGYGFYRHAGIGTGSQPEREIVLRQLQLAKEALIAYALKSATRPGRLPCPDVTGDGASSTFEGDNCPNYRGALPWKTLDITETSDSQGVPFRYILSPVFGDNRDATQLNSETEATLHLDVASGSTDKEIAAVIIAQRGTLDPRNADSDDYFYNGSGNAPEDNDIVMPLTRRELMAAVEQRIANELRACLEQHANSASNTEKTYPWPAPPASSNYKGTTGSLFGRVADTQPGNPKQVLKELIVKFSTSKTTLTAAPTVTDQLAAAEQLQIQAAQARALFDRLFINAADLASKAAATQTAFSGLYTTLTAATADNAAFTAQAASLPAAVSTALPSLRALLDSLKNSGFDLFLPELRLQNSRLKNAKDVAAASRTSANFSLLLLQINIVKDSLLNHSWSPNSEINNRLAAAYNTANTAYTAVDAATNVLLQGTSSPEPWVSQALAEASNLYTANAQIETTLLTYRSNIDADEVAFRAGRVSATLLAAAAAGYSAASLGELVLVLDSSRSLVSSLTATASGLVGRRSASLGVLDSALAAARAGQDQNLIRTTAEAAAAQLAALATALAGTGDNIAAETLNAMIAVLEGNSQAAPPASLTAAQALRDNEVQTVIYWADRAVDQTADLARAAKKSLGAQNNSETSAYTAANRVLTSMDGVQDSIALLTKAQARPEDSAAQQAAQAALNETLTRLDALIDAANRLDNQMETGMAQAVLPTAWLGSACAFLQPATGSTPSWWTAHHWNSLLFYQLSDRIRPATGTLSVNGGGTYRVVAVAAGNKLAGQDRLTQHIGQYLEKTNADASRNGEARTPANRFIVETLAPDFNDRLAY